MVSTYRDPSEAAVMAQGLVVSDIRGRACLPSRDTETTRLRSPATSIATTERPSEPMHMGGESQMSGAKRLIFPLERSSR